MQVAHPNGQPFPSAPHRELVDRAARGDSTAFAQLYEQCAPGVRRYVRGIIWDTWDADDVTQEVFVKIFLGLSGYDPGRASFSAWMLRIAHNAAIDHLRRSRVRPSLAAVDDQVAFDEAGAQCGESLRNALEELTHNEREVLVLRALGGLTPSELAALLNRSRGSVNTLYHRARVAARNTLAANAEGPSTYPAQKKNLGNPAGVVPVAA
jgi:RNA polymerase sigma-70 factor, ECF subfamily